MDIIIMLLLVSDTPMGSGPGWAKKEGPPKQQKGYLRLTSALRRV